MPALRASLLAGSLLLLGLAAAPTASASCLGVLHFETGISCALCSSGPAVELACNTQAGANAIATCVVDGLPNVIVDPCVI